MPLWLLSDPHLSKNMAKFGAAWEDHVTKLRERWDATVGPDDIVLCPGDVSWAENMDDVRSDLAWLHERPGEVVMVKGNHDWWWNSTMRVRSVLPPSVHVLDGDAMVLRGVIFAGAKGTVSANDPYFRPENEKGFRRALARFGRALDHARRLKEVQPAAPVVALLHYPPCTSDGQETDFARRVESAGFVEHCVFGHFHLKPEWDVCYDAPRGGVHYHLGSCDYLDFTPKRLAALPGE